MLWSWLQLRRETREWIANGCRESAEASGIRWSSTTWRSAEGERGDYRLSVALERRAPPLGGNEEQDFDELVARLACHRLPQRLRFAAETGDGLDLLTGDNLFDEAVEIQGEASFVAALLSEPARERIRSFAAWGGALENGTLELRRRAAFSLGEIALAVRTILDTADVLTSSEGGGVCERLARNALGDPRPGVRLWNLTLLQQEFADRPETSATSRAALADGSAWMRLAGARFLEAEGLEVLKALLEERHTPDHASAEAVALLSARLSRADAGVLLLPALKQRTGETRRQAIKELGRLRCEAALGPLCVLLGRPQERTAVAAADALGALGDVRAEIHLVDALRRDAPELRIAVARALGAVGSVKAVQPLLELLEAKRLDGESRQALREAVSAIQSRLAGAEAGQVSLATPAAEAGRLSLATPTAGPGDVSLAEGARYPPAAKDHT